MGIATNVGANAVSDGCQLYIVSQRNLDVSARAHRFKPVVAALQRFGQAWRLAPVRDDQGPGGRRGFTLGLLGPPWGRAGRIDGMSDRGYTRGKRHASGGFLQ